MIPISFNNVKMFDQLKGCQLSIKEKSKHPKLIPHTRESKY